MKGEKTGELDKKRVVWDEEKDARTEAVVDEVAGELPHQLSQPFRYLGLSLRCSRVPHGWGQGRAGGQARPGSSEQES